MVMIGINVVEVPGKISPAVLPAETSVAGFVIRSERGIPGEAVRITNMRQFLQVFGGYSAAYLGHHAVAGFFLNGGGTAYVTRVVDSTATAATLALHDETQDVLVLTAGRAGHAEPGPWGAFVSVAVAEGVAADQFTLTVSYGGETETFSNLTLATAIDVINNELTGSKFVTAGPPPTPPTTPGHPVVLAATNLVGGLLGGVPSASQYVAALDAFDRQNVQLLAIPEDISADFNGVTQGGLTKAKSMGDRFFVGHLLDGLDVSGATAAVGGLRGDKVYGALYYPWVQVLDERTGQPIWIPPTGHVLGVYARTDQERGVWKAPAGDAASLDGVLDVHSRLTQQNLTDLVLNASVNGIRFLRGKGIIIDSSRTLSTNSNWFYVNVRLLFNFVKSSLKNSLRWAVHEPNDAILRSRVDGVIRSFLMSLWRRQAFGPGAPADVFTIQISNDPDEIQRGELNLKVSFYPSRPAETVIIKVGQQGGATSVSEG